MPRGARRSCEDDDQDQCCRRDKCHDIQDAPPSYGCGQAPRGSKREGDPGHEPTACHRWSGFFLTTLWVQLVMEGHAPRGRSLVRRQTWQKLACLLLDSVCDGASFSKLFLLFVCSHGDGNTLSGPSTMSERTSPETWYQAHNLLEPRLHWLPQHNLCTTRRSITLDHAAIGDGIHDALSHALMTLPLPGNIPRPTRVSSPCPNASQLSKSAVSSLCLPGHPVDQP